MADKQYFRVIGTVMSIGDHVSHSTKSGASFTIQALNLEVDNQPWPSCFTFKNHIDLSTRFKHGDTVTITFNIVTRSHNDKVYTNLNPTQILKF